MGRGLVNGVGANYKPISGQRFGRLQARKDVGRDRDNNALWDCLCDCGMAIVVSSASLRSGHTASCGCLQRDMRGKNKFVDMTGMRFGRLTIVSQAGRSPHKKILWNVICDCGTEKVIIGASMTAGRTVSCGCYNSDRTANDNQTHGMSGTPEYQVWGSMIARCVYPTATRYEAYGGRGISVCKEWMESFEAFYAFMGDRPSPDHSIDRYPDPDGDYEPGNVRWATPTEQANNKRSNVLIPIEGVSLTLKQWCNRRNLAYSTVHSRISKLGWSPEEALGFKERA